MSLADGLQFRVGLDLRPAELALMEFRGKADSIGRGLGSLKSAAVGVGATLGAGLMAGATALNAILSAGGEMEAFESRLTTLMGSSTEARARLGELFDFAARTPFELNQIVAAEVTLRGFSADTEALMGGLIDFTAATGAELQQSAIDFGKAWSQGATGLESDFGKILRKQIELRAGVDATKMDLVDFRTTMLEVLNEGMFAGGAEKLSQTFTGMVSNLKDEWSRFKLEVADAGVFNNIKGVLAATLSLISTHRTEVSALASAVSGGLWQGFRMVSLAIAAAVDAARGLGLFIDVAKVATGEWIEMTAGGLANIQFALADTARAVGMDGLAGAYDEAGNQLNRAAMWAQSMSEEGRAGIETLGQTATAVDTVRGMLDAAEASAKGMGSALSEMGGTTPAGAGEVGTGKKAGEDPMLAELEAAFAFADEMAAIQQTETQQLQAEYAERLEMLLNYYDQGLITGQLYRDTLAAIDADYYAQTEAMRLADAERERETRRELGGYWVDATVGALGAIESMLDQSNAKQKVAAKVLAGSQIAISGIVAQAKAWEAGWPAGLPLSIKAAATTAGQIAALASAHQGRYLMGLPRHQGGMAPDEVNLRALRTEGVVNSQAARNLGEQGLMEINGGRSPATELVVNLGRTQTREIQREERRSGGPMTRLIKDVFTAASSGDRDTGFSGRRAFA